MIWIYTHIWNGGAGSFFFFFLQFFLSAFHVEPHGRNAVEALNGRCPTHRTNNYIYKMERKRQRRRSVRDPRVDPSPIKKKNSLFSKWKQQLRAHIQRTRSSQIIDSSLPPKKKKKSKIISQRATWCKSTTNCEINAFQVVWCNHVRQIAMITIAVRYKWLGLNGICEN